MNFNEIFEPRKNCLENQWIKGMMHDVKFLGCLLAYVTYTKISAHVRDHIQQLLQQLYVIVES